jgi:hypothetical protein
MKVYFWYVICECLLGFMALLFAYCRSGFFAPLILGAGFMAYKAVKENHREKKRVLSE